MPEEKPEPVNFNPRSREGSDPNAHLQTIYADISIHAPAKEATMAYLDDNSIPVISIHAPAKEAT